MKEKIILTICFILITVFTVLIIRYEPLLSTDTTVETNNTTNTTNIVNTTLNETTSLDSITENTIENTIDNTIETTKTQSDFCTVIKDSNNVLYGLKHDGTKIKLAETIGAYKNFDVFNNTLYYVDTNYNLHTVTLDNTNKDTNLNITLNQELWDFSVCDSKLILFANGENFYQEIYDLNTKESQVLPFTNGNNEYFYNKLFFYTDRITYDLSSYNVETKKIEKISEEGRILVAKENIILYESSDTIYKYDILLNKSEELETPKDFFMNQGPIILTENNNIYLLESSNILYTYTDNKLTKLIDLTNKDYNYTVLDIFPINNDTILIAENCFGEVDVPEGFGYEEITSNKYLYTISTNKLEKTTDKKYDFFSAESGLDVVYVK